MSFGFWDVIQVLGALCFFIYGMKMMSDGIQRAAGSQLRNILRTMTKNRFFGVGTGFITTALVQSSSATTVMTVSFVNAGLLTLVESAGIMMGANIGTTITGWIVSVLGFKINLSAYSIPLFAVGVPMLFSNRSKFKYWGEFIIGFAILFLGLNYLKSAVPNLRGNPEVLDFLANFTNWGIFSRIFFVFIGTLITIIVQSSSAAMAITLTMCAQGWIPFEVAAAMILGENIGTTITAEVASLVGNTNAKRSARIHSMFNIIGVTWMVILLPYFLPILSNLAQSFLGISDPYLDTTDMPIGLSAFHTAFNLMNVLIMIGFVNFLVKAARWSVPDKEGDVDEYRLKFIGAGIRTPELATVELQKETAHFGEITSRMSIFAKELINTTDAKLQKKKYKKLSKYEKITDKLEIEITEYITKLSNQEITPRTSTKLRSILNICNELESIGDLFYQISKTIEQKNENRNYFLPEQRNGLNEMFVLIDKAFKEMNRNLNESHYDKVDISRAEAIEKEINRHRNNLRKENQSMLGSEGYSVESAMIYNNIFNSLEKIGDHIISVNEAIIGEV
ncbi:Na/Pi cotransporter family protein [Portibacter marinus]|uniref:Na/Pi cotransporter family protein n=1 Tax=Portibacter marinus TaxID=2898660 RepID=UPI001F31E730|nr:Na/Pi cotransporter family protein [Portibacter marinus]